jgi:hypothetical protein
MTSDVELYRDYRIEYLVREVAGIVRVTALVTGGLMPGGQPPHRFAAEARDEGDARRSARGQAVHWIDNVAPAHRGPD